VVAAALAAEQRRVPVAHVEAGLRSYDRRMPEESNRIITDHLSAHLFAVTDVQLAILTGEGIPRERIHVVGNTIADAVMQNVALSAKRTILATIGVQPQEYFLFTAHRAANVDEPAALTEVCGVLESLHGAHPGKPLVWPMHPRTARRFAEYGLALPPGVVVSKPQGYLDFLRLLTGAALVITDSGGVQEEACILGVPCITLRDSTERPETLRVGANRLTGRSREAVLAAVAHFENPLSRGWPNPFGDGRSAERIVDVLVDAYMPERKAIPAQRSETVCVVGLGYMGLPTAALFANAGYRVTGVDIDASRVAAVNAGRVAATEPGLAELVGLAVRGGRLHAQSIMPRSDVFIIAVPTAAKNEACDLTHVRAAVAAVSAVVRDGNLVILESTVKPGTCRDELRPALEKHAPQVMIAHCPERAIPGNTLHEIVHNDRIVGGLTPAATARTIALYQCFCRGQVLGTDATTAEAVKLMENSFRDVNIAFANELAGIADELRFDVWQAIALANRHPRVAILQPGPGVGGHCIAVDPWFLTQDSAAARLIRTARQINDARPAIIAGHAAAMAARINAKRIGILGVAYKKGVDDARESPAAPIFEQLSEAGFEVRAHDPYVTRWIHPLIPELDELAAWAQVLVLVTDHSQYRARFAGGADSHRLLDTRNCLSAPA
jgi:UDP-N-acetylglucosamine 2-epimerase (non-hydrolysing)